MSKISGIYAIICLENGKYYVGSSTDFNQRKRKHFSSLKRNSHPNSHLQNTFNLYGEKSLCFLILEDVPKELLILKEQGYLDNALLNRHQTMNLSFIAGRVEMTPEVREKISKSNIGKKGWMSGKSGKSSPHFGSHRSLESKIKMSQSQLKEKNHFFGKHHSQISKNKISITLSGRIPTWKQKPVRQIHPKTKEVIQVHPSIFNAAKFIFPEIERAESAASNISRVCNKTQHFNTAYGFKWEYA